MAVTNYSKRCTSCGGNKWEYLKDLKIWECRYCGSQVERQEQYDGLYTIKNVVRQVILDAAYRRMDQADRNLSECQKIDARYPGTLIAGICFRLIAAVSPESCPNHDPRSLLGQLKRDYQTLTEEGKDLTDDETAVYEFLDSSDAWAVLAMVFDTLGDAQRREYLLTLTEPNKVFSKETNKSMLRFALKNDRMDLAEAVLSNHDNVDIRDAFTTVLESCPDGPKKGSLAAGLLQSGALKAGEEDVLETYLGGNDCVDTKAAVALAGIQSGLGLQLELLLREIMGNAELPMLQEMLSTVFSRRLYDGEIEQLLSFASAQPAADRCLAVLEAMTASGQFIALNPRQAQEFMTNTDFTPAERLAILKQLRGYDAADRTWEAVAGEYLCRSSEPVQDRKVMLEGLCSGLNSIPARDFERYVMESQADELEKPDRIKIILDLPGMNSGFFRELPGKYLKSGRDPEEVKTVVLHQLLDSGLVIDGSVLVDYVCNAKDTPDEKVELVQMAVRNGTAIRSDALSIYLEKCYQDYSPKLFALLYSDSSKVTAKAMENFVLRCKDSSAVKAKNAYALASHTGMKLGSGTCRIQHLGNMVSCSLAQAYILTTTDDISGASAMVQTMTQSGVKLSTDIEVAGRSKRFNKYLNENRDRLSKVTEQLCEDNKLFSFSFSFF